MHLSAIPIVILHRNEFASLFQMLDSIRKNTKYPYKIFVVDNNSSTASKSEELTKIRLMPDVTLIESNVNNWVLGFNLALKHEDWPSDAMYYIFSDSDIVLPDLSADKICWLEHMVQQMNLHACIGKLGISLRVDDIDNEVLKEDVVRQSDRFNKNPKIGDNVIAPVDTTLAIYRKNFFIGESFRFSVGHASLARPYYYTCRTSDMVKAKHLGWYKETSLDLNGVFLKEKIRCFAKFGGYIEPSVLNVCSRADKYFYKIVRPFSLMYWGARVLILNARYLFSRFPRHVNELQSECR